MISRRNYVAIILMMLVILFMFQFSQIIKENGNEYDTNAYKREDILNGAQAWGNALFSEGEEGFLDQASFDAAIASGAIAKDASYVLYLGEKDAKLYEIVSRWCYYAKKYLVCYEKPEDIQFAEGKVLPEMLIFDGSRIEKHWDCVLQQVKMTKLVNRCSEAGVPVVFSNLPDVSLLEKNENLCKMLGIRSIEASNTTCSGIRLLDGFLLGGESFYLILEETPENLEKQDLVLEMPWYLPTKGTKVFMSGMMSDEEISIDHYPMVIWRNIYQDDLIFAVNGNYLETEAGYGMLSAFCYEANPYYLYPVVDAHCFSVVDFPALSDENDSRMRELYNRSITGFQRDISWPSILSLALNNDISYTFFLNSKYDYADAATPDPEQYIFYLQRFKESGSEAGKSLRYRGLASITEKLDLDKQFYQSVTSGYMLSAYYTDAATEDFKEELRNRQASQTEKNQFHTLVAEDTCDNALLSYYTDDTLLLGVTANASTYSFSRDLALRSFNTAFAYGNTLIDLHSVIWPESEADQWQNYFKIVSSNLATYYAKDHSFDSVTISECDSRVRSFINLHYVENREENRIFLQTDEAGMGSYFVLRTHDEEITSVVGGEFKELEKNAYLIHVQDEKVQIDLKPCSTYSYRIPF